MISSLKFLFFFFLSYTCLAIEPTYSISESGKEKVYKVSQSEFQCSPKDGSKQFTHTLKNAVRNNDIVAKAKLIAKETKSNVEIIIYPKNEPQTKFSKRVVSNEAYVKVKKGESIADIVKLSGAKSYRTLSFTKEYIILTFTDSWTCLEKTAALKDNKKVNTAYPLLKKLRAKKSVPNDPFYLYSSSNSGYLWHLNNTGDNNAKIGIDVNISQVWNNYTGTGITIGIIDDGVQTDHPDLVANVNTAIDFNWNDGNSDDPSPGTGDNHGTPCAGVAAGVGNNNIGVTGAAPNASIVGLRLIASSVSDLAEAEAMSHESAAIQVKSNSWGPFDGQGTLDDAGNLTKAAFTNTVTNGRNGLGTIHLWAAGNGGDNDNVNFDGYANSIYTIAIGAINDLGNRASYSEPGAAKLVSATSDGGNQAITSTQIDSSYTYSFGGTSSATPLAAGVVALMLEANPNLGWRDVQEILIRSARQVNPAETSWTMNGASIPFSHEYGAGLIDAELAVKLSENWTNLAAQQSHTVTANGLPQNIPDNAPNGLSVNFNVPAGNNFRLEHVTLTTDITHPNPSDLTISLTSPSGTTSILSNAGILSAANISNWTFMSVFNWGESSTGTWTLTVTDSVSSNTGSLNNASLTLYGAPLQPAAAAVPTFISNSTTTGYSGVEFHFKTFATDKITSYSATNLPAGLSINMITGAITGTATTPGTYNATITATNAIGSTDTPLEIILLNPNDRPPILSSSSLITLELGTPYSYQITANFSPTSYSATNLPNGLTVNTSTGLISGTPTTLGSTQVAITVSNAFGTDSMTLTINVIESFIASYADALDNDQLTFDTSTINNNDPTTIWINQTTNFQVDNDALESPSISHNGTTSFSITLSEPSAVTFWAKTSTEESYDTLTVSTDTRTLLNLSGEKDWAQYTVIASEATTLTWTYSKDNGLNSGADKVWVDAVTVSNEIPDPIIAEALDFRGLNWPNDHSFILDKTNHFDGVDALRFPIVGGDSNHTLEVDVEGPGTLSFYYKVSSEEDFDFFDFKMDGNNLINVSGETAWIQYNLNIPTGTHTLQWIYTKDTSVNTNEDTVFLDKLTYIRSDLSHLENWKLAQFTPEENASSTFSGDNSDPDRDGIPNLLEYATGNSPFSALNAHPITHTSNQTEMSLEYSADTSAVDATLSGQYSLNLSSWLPRTHSVLSTSGNMEMRKISYPLNTGKAFLRLKATKN